MKKKKLVVCQAWEESERGWRVRPDGSSLHKDYTDLTAFVREHWAKMPEKAPSIYSRPSGVFSCIEIDEDSEQYKKLLASKNGIFVNSIK